MFSARVQYQYLGALVALLCHVWQMMAIIFGQRVTENHDVIAEGAKDLLSSFSPLRELDCIPGAFEHLVLRCQDVGIVFTIQDLALRAGRRPRRLRSNL